MTPAERERFLAERRLGLGGSDVASVLSPDDAFSTPYQVRAEKRGELEPADISAEPRVWWGVQTEEAHAAWYALQTSSAVVLQRNEVIVHPDEPILRGHPDAIRLGDSRRLVELKWVAADQRHTFDAGPPLKYQLQVQHYLGIGLALGVFRDTTADLSVIFGGNDWQAFQIHYNAEFFAAWRMAARDWWDRHVVAGEPIAPSADDLGAVKKLYPKPRRPAVDLPADLVALDAEYAVVDAEAKRTKKRADEIKAQLLDAIGDADAGRLPNGVLWTAALIERDAFTVKATSFRQLRRYA